MLLYRKCYITIIHVLLLKYKLVSKVICIINII